ncbi:nuclease domain-containing protein, partial [Streptomyces sp. P17]|uniref:nuclease domain-containing protein n=1 Tax=Streptomyces sp. P17 TaxID=3074716 RepID=UPI0028F456E3
VTLPKTNELDIEKKFIWIFDAKYRIKLDKNRFDDGSDDITKTDYVPDDAINQMHRYRDALIRLSGSEIKTGNVSPNVDNLSTRQNVKKSRP